MDKEDQEKENKSENKEEGEIEQKDKFFTFFEKIVEYEVPKENSATKEEK